MCIEAARPWRRTALLIILLAILCGGFATRAFAQLPPPTNPNLTRLGYYFVNEKYGDSSSYVWPYTNLYIALPDNAVDQGVTDWQDPFAASLQKATISHKAIWLRLGACQVAGQIVNNQVCQMGWSDILSVAAPYWNQIEWVELGEESELPTTLSGMTAVVDFYNSLAGPLGLGPRSLGITLGPTQAVPGITDAANEPRLSWINIEAFEDPSKQNESTSALTSDLESYLDTAKGLSDNK